MKYRKIVIYEKNVLKMLKKLFGTVISICTHVTQHLLHPSMLVFFEKL